MKNSDLTHFAKKVLVATLVVLSLISLLYFGYRARTPLLWIGIAAFLAVAINPLVHQLKNYMPKKSISLATLLILFGVSAIIVGLVWAFFAPFVQQTIKLISEIPALIGKANNVLANGPLPLDIPTDSIKSFMENNRADLLGFVTSLVGILASVIIGIVDAAVAYISVISLIFFMTVEGRTLKSFTTRLIKPEFRERAAGIGKSVYDIINGYVVGNFIVSMIFGAASAVVLWLTGSPYYLVLALMAGLIDLVPLVGTTIAAILVLIVSILSGQPWAGVIFAIYSIVYVQLENSVINPAVYSNKVSVSPLIVLISILLGAAVAGILGALVAIPIAATTRVLVYEVFKDRLQKPTPEHGQ